MNKKKGKDLYIVLIACLLTNLTNLGMHQTNLAIAKIALLCLTAVFSLVTVIFSIRGIISVFASPTEKATHVDQDKLELKRKIMVYVFGITFLLAIVGFCIFYFFCI